MTVEDLEVSSPVASPVARPRTDERVAARSGRSHWRGRRPSGRSATRAVLILAAAAVAAIGIHPAVKAAPSFDDGLTNRSGPAAGPVTIEQGSAALVWQPGVVPAVTVQVANDSDRPVTASVWWLLARVGDRQPWIAPVATGRTSSLRLAADATQVVHLTGQPPRAAGTFVLSAWTHYQDTAGLDAPSDGRGFSSPIRVAAPSPVFDRRGTPHGGVLISAVRADRSWRAGGPGRIDLQLTNPEVEPKVVEVWWFIRPFAGPAHQRLAPWRDLAATRSPTVSSVVSGAQSRWVAIPMPHLPGPGTYEVSAWLHSAYADDTQTPEDGGWLRTPVVISPQA